MTDTRGCVSCDIRGSCEKFVWRLCDFCDNSMNLKRLKHMKFTIDLFLKDSVTECHGKEPRILSLPSYVALDKFPSLHEPLHSRL